jgi:soluble P-type ATPase
MRPNAPEAIRSLHTTGVQKVVMLSGDNQRTVNAIAQQAGVDEAHGDLLPDQKIEQVRSLLDKHKHVGMIGDGVNDAPAMAAATVGIAMGAGGTDTAIETADIALMKDDLSKVAEAVLRGNRCSARWLCRSVRLGNPETATEYRVPIYLDAAHASSLLTPSSRRLLAPCCPCGLAIASGLGRCQWSLDASLRPVVVRRHKPSSKTPGRAVAAARSKSLLTRCARRLRRAGCCASFVTPTPSTDRCYAQGSRRREIARH